MITFIFTTAALLSHIFFVGVLLVLIFNQKVRGLVYDFVNKYVVWLLFLTSFSALIGSLLYSEIIGFPPCDLCWIQRIFMYPQVALAFMALIKKDKSIAGYLLPLSLMGAIVSLYHSLTSWGFGASLLACTAVGGACSKVFVLSYGYITIPFMSFTVFAYLILTSIIYYKSKQKII